jgi:hypothetical protein
MDGLLQFDCLANEVATEVCQTVARELERRAV